VEIKNAPSDTSVWGARVRRMREVTHVTHGVVPVCFASLKEAGTPASHKCQCEGDCEDIRKPPS
jgi:hypothetical protein